MSNASTADKNLLREWIHWIMGGLVAWGLLLGLGVYLYGRYSEIPTQPPLRSNGVVLNPKEISRETPGTPPILRFRSTGEEKEAILRGIIVATCVVAFVTFWWVMLALRERKVARLGKAAKGI